MTWLTWIKPETKNQEPRTKNQEPRTKNLNVYLPFGFPGIPFTLSSHHTWEVQPLRGILLP
ncbi:hypothetical protein D0962_12145 [Leptolyngbyaceae cyanobacterium CCMR0082]|uniref:Uncharacterized protein n=1 Tax=Adonisia turfae CCMR0082 TaxID=2304604 RepID=A0A6M0S4T9_9CYAN|nr:hypothetical protein [Adonisia turfae CCMR0082]